MGYAQPYWERITRGKSSKGLHERVQRRSSQAGAKQWQARSHEPNPQRPFQEFSFPSLGDSTKLEQGQFSSWQITRSGPRVEVQPICSAYRLSSFLFLL